MNKKFIIFIILIIILIIFQLVKDIRQQMNINDLSFQDWYWNISYVKPKSISLKDNQTLYLEDKTKVRDLYLIILPSFDDEGKEITFNELNSHINFREDKPTLNVHFVNTDQSIDSSLQNQSIKNATITLRGHSTMEAEQKSYKIKFLNQNSFLGFNILNLNKHAFDSYKVRNKIAFELFEEIPNITSMRTRLINLYIKDMTNREDKGFVDYGLFTHIEQPNSNFLKEHNLDDSGYLYKAEEFEFFRYEDTIRDIEDPLYDESEFSLILEPKVAKNHEKIIKMLDDVNNFNLNIDKVLDTHFNRDNYFTWLAINILLGNYDTVTQNFLLYSTHDNPQWYLLPWDYDGSLGEDLSMQYDADGNFQALVGVANYWNSTLHQRVFQNRLNLLELNKKIEEVYSILTKEKLESVSRKYLSVVKEEYSKNQIYRRDFKIEDFNDIIEQISNTPNKNRRLYYEYLEKPMPIWLGDIEKVENGYYFFWTESFDLQGDSLSYTLQISYSPDFSDVFYEKTRIRDSDIEIDIEPGEYFWRIIVVDGKGNTQRAFDQYKIEVNKSYFGIKRIVIE